MFLFVSDLNIRDNCDITVSDITVTSLSLKMLRISPSCSREAGFDISAVGEAERSRKTKAAGMSLSC